MNLTKYAWPSTAVALFVLGLWLGKQGGQVEETLKVKENVTTVASSNVKETKTKTTKPDGTVTETVIKESKTKSKEKSEKSVVASKEAKLDTIRVSALARINYPQLLPPTYGLGVERRLWDSPVWVGVQVYQDRSVALSVSVTF